eukprot:gb/GFBE01023866.1/.p1 GENE.gb/GFBE01023866.1/~~gb/GFBE01023866.1/.p1  ORF type:complete len:211 (+),score=59.07 gb/GFBE01023866.1/:1-633(+)
MPSMPTFMTVHIVLAALCHGASAVTSASQDEVSSNHTVGSWMDWGFKAPESLKKMFTNKCTGSKHPQGKAPFCFSGEKLGETVTVKVSRFDAEEGKGHLKFMATGAATVSCGSDFTKSKQTILFRKECIPTGIDSLNIKFCSRQNSILLRGTVETTGTGTEMLLQRIDCPEGKSLNEIVTARTSMMRNQKKSSVRILDSGDVEQEESAEE